MATMTAKTQQYIDQDKRYGAQNYGPLPVVLERGEGVFVWDVEGKRYFDMLSAYSAVNQGHNHPKIIAAAKAQMDRLCLTSRAFYNDKMGALLEKLAGITGMEKILLMNSGAEAVETAIKAMRRWGYEVKGIPEGKAEIIVCAENFHGRTSTIVSFSTDPDSYAGYGPKMPGFKVIPYDDPAALEKAITTSTCGFLVEPVQGEAGVKVPSEGFLKAARELCTKHNVLLAVDEIQTGLGRTGKMFCFEHSGIRPDIIVMGKALSGGVYPISAIAADDAVMKVFKPGTHGSTYGGNSLASAIGVAALDVLVGEKLPEKAQKMGEYFRAKLDAIKHPLLKERRGKGLLLALEFTKPIAKDFCKKMMARGLLAKDTHAVTVRFAPPLIITKAQIDEAVAIIEAALQDLD